MQAENKKQKFPGEQSKGLRVAGQSLAGVVLGFSCLGLILSIVIMGATTTIGGVTGFGDATSNIPYIVLGALGIVFSLALIITISVFLGKINSYKEGKSINYFGFGIAILVLSIIGGVILFIASFDGWIIFILGIISGSLLLTYAGKNKQK